MKLSGKLIINSSIKMAFEALQKVIGTGGVLLIGIIIRTVVIHIKIL
jgi:hypothetical protein